MDKDPLLANSEQEDVEMRAPSSATKSAVKKKVIDDFFKPIHIPNSSN